MLKGYKANQRQVKETKVNIQRILRILSLLFLREIQSFVKISFCNSEMSHIPRINSFTIVFTRSKFIKIKQNLQNF